MGLDVHACINMPNSACHWGPGEDKKCQDEVSEAKGLTGKCLCFGNGKAHEAECHGKDGSVDQCMSNPNCNWGPSQNPTCAAERTKFEAPKHNTAARVSQVQKLLATEMNL